jgi:hypothetical protein
LKRERIGETEMTYARIGKYSATAPTLSDGETTFLRTNVNGDVLVGLSGSNTRKPFAVASAKMPAATAGAHLAGDVVSGGAVLEFETGLAAGGSGIILSSYVWHDNGAVFAAGAGYSLKLYNVAPTNIADNTAWDLPVAEADRLVAEVSVSTLVDKGATVYVFDFGHNIDFCLAAGDTKLYGLPVCNGGETTVQDKTIYFGLGIAAL